MSSDPRGAADLAHDTRVARDPDAPSGAPRYRAALDTSWDYLRPAGGVLAVVAVRAAEAELGDPDLHLASATTIFAAPLHPGPLAADVTVLRRGGAAAQVRVAVRNTYAPGHEDKASEGLEVLATFARARTGPDVDAATWPGLPSPADCPDAVDDHPANPYRRYPFYHQLDVRLADGEPSWRVEVPPGPSRYARWFRFRAPVRDAAGRLPRWALLPLADTMPSALSRAIGASGYRFYAPSLDLTVQWIADTRREWLLARVAVRRALDGLALGEVELWDDDRRLLAIGSQSMFLQGVAGEPPTVDARSR